MTFRLPLILALVTLLVSACATSGPSGLTEVPSPIFQPPPQYPFELRRADITGSATVDFVITSQGDVVNAYAIAATDPAFGEAAVAAVMRWKFKPGMRNGAAVNVHTQVPIDFSLSAEENANTSPPK